MTIGEFGWAIGLHCVMSVWIGLLAVAWKGRNVWAWAAIGLATSLVGLVILARMPRLPRRAAKRAAPLVDMELQHLDGTRLQ